MSTTVEKPTKKPSKMEKKSKEAVTSSTQPKSVSKNPYLTETPSVASSSFAGISMLGIKPYELKEDESYMNDAQLKHFKTLLLKWKQMLMEEVDQTVSHLRHEAPNLLADPNDRATREENLFFELRARNREGKLLKKIEEALEKIERGEYGYCDVCGVEIGIRRLEARPTANLCIDCKTYDEIKEKQQGG